MSQLRIFNEVPKDLFDCQPYEVEALFPELSLLHLPGKSSQILFISILLHGNEFSGLKVIQNILQKYEVGGHPLPRSLMVLFGNVKAAAKGVRHLPDQKDFNRIWVSQEQRHPLVPEVLHFLQSQEIFASIDIHNNTGINPYYACINQIDHPFLHLARLFNRTIVYFTKPESVLSRAMSKFCPSVTLECGQPGDAVGIQRTTDFVEEVLHLKNLPSVPFESSNSDVFHSIIRIKIPEKATFGFKGELDKGVDFSFLEKLDHMNFVDLQKNTLIGWRFNNQYQLIALDENNQDVGSDFVKYEGNEIRLKRPLVPSMLTKNEKVVRQDCLGYLMQRYEI